MSKSHRNDTTKFRDISSLLYFLSNHVNADMFISKTLAKLANVIYVCDTINVMVVKDEIANALGMNEWLHLDHMIEASTHYYVKRCGFQRYCTVDNPKELVTIAMNLLYATYTHDKVVCTLCNQIETLLKEESLSICVV